MWRKYLIGKKGQSVPIYPPVDVKDYVQFYKPKNHGGLVENVKRIEAEQLRGINFDKEMDGHNY